MGWLAGLLQAQHSHHTKPPGAASFVAAGLVKKLADRINLLEELVRSIIAASTEPFAVDEKMRMPAQLHSSGAEGQGKERYPETVEEDNVIATDVTPTASSSNLNADATPFVPQSKEEDEKAIVDDLSVQNERLSGLQ